MDPRETEYEIELLHRVGRGDQPSLALLYDRLAGILFSTALRILNDHSAAEDVLQDVFVQIWEKASLYDVNRGKPLTWAITLTRNKAIDRLRATQRRHRLRDDFEREQQSGEVLSDKSASESLQAGEKSQLVRKAVAELTPSQRKAIELAFFGGLTQVEIAERLNEPLGTIKARIRRGMMKLHEILGSTVARTE